MASSNQNEDRIMKRMVYECSHTKEGLYLSVLSRVSRDTMDRVNQKLPEDAEFENIRNIFMTLFDVLEKSDTFVRLWAWEELDTTINGIRLLETVSAIFERIRRILAYNAKKGKIKSVPDTLFDKIKMLCHGYLISLTIYLKDKQEVGVETGRKSPALKRLNMSMELQGMALDAITSFIDTHLEK